MAFEPVMPLQRLRPDRPCRVEFAPDRVPYAIALLHVGGSFYALEDRCTHVDYPLSEGDVHGEDIVCPLHGACFNIKTGAPTCGPCHGPVRTYPVRIVGDMIEVDLAAAASEARPESA